MSMAYRPGYGEDHELNAINKMLSIIGEMQIASLNEARMGEASIAQQCLAEATEELQLSNWWFNTLYKEFTPDSLTKEIRVPLNCSAIWSPHSSHTHLTLQDGRIFDRVRNSFKFDSTVWAVMRIVHQFAELPFTARQLAATRASKKFQMRVNGSTTLDAAVKEEEAQQLAALIADDVREGRPDLLHGAGGWASQAITRDRGWGPRRW